MILPIMLPIQIQILYTPTVVSKLSHLIVNSSVICIIISVIVVLANLIDYFINGYNNESSAVFLFYTFFTLFVMFALLCIAGAVKQLLVCLKVGFIVWVVLLVIWVTTCSIQFTTWYSVSHICLNNRCAESLWLSDFYYLAFEEVVQTSTTKPPSNTSLVHLQNTTQNPGGETSSASNTLLTKNYLFVSLFVIVFVSFFFFFIFLGSMMYSYHDALYYLNEGDQLVTVPPAAYIFILPFRGFYEARTSFSPAEVPEDKNKAVTSDNKKEEKSEENLVDKKDMQPKRM